MPKLRGTGEKRGPEPLCPTCNNKRVVRAVGHNGADSGDRTVPCPTCRFGFNQVVGAMDDLSKAAGAGPPFTPGVALHTICVHGNQPWECKLCEARYAEWKANVKKQKEQRETAAELPDRLRAGEVAIAARDGNLRFRLSQIRVERVNVDSEPTTGPLADRPEDENWQDIVVTVQDRAGNVFEVARVTCRYDGMLGESTAAGKLVKRVSWDDAFADDLICPLCFERGHGAGACPRR